MPSDGDVFSRADVGSSVDHKTTARRTKLRPGQPHVPTRHGGNQPTGAWVAWAAVGALAARLHIQAKFAQKRILEAVPVGRGARDAYPRAPRDAPDPPWSVGTNLGEESAESGGR